MPTATEDRVAIHLAALQSSVAELVTGEQWQRYLRVQARFHSYSFWNTVAILRAARCQPVGRVPTVAPPGPSGPEG